MEQPIPESVPSRAADRRSLLRSILLRAAATSPALTEAQSRLWEIDSHERSIGVHEFSILYSLQGSLDPGLLEEAFQAVARCHDILRARIGMNGNQAVFELVTLSHPILEVKDVVSDDELNARVAEEVARPLHLAESPGWRVVLFRTDPNHHSLLLHFHHIIADRWSVGVLIADLTAAYCALLEGQEPLPGRSSVAASFVARPVLESAIEYWRRLFTSRPEMLLLPLAHSDGSRVSHEGGRIEAELPRPTVEALKALAVEEQTTLFAVLIAAFCALLHSHTGQEDLIISTALAGRQQPASRTVIGYFNNIMPLRLSVAGDPTVREFIRSASTQIREMAANQEVPFHRIAALPELEGRRITQCLFTLQNIPGLDLTLPGITSSYRDVPNGTTNFDLALFAEEKDGALRMLLDYKTGVFEKAAVELLKDRFVAAAQTAAESPSLPVSKFTQYRANEPVSDLGEVTSDTQGDPDAQNMLEQKMIEVWREVFSQADAGSLHATTDFFALGGDSMRAARLFQSIQRRFHVDLPLATLFEASTPRSLAQKLSDQEWVPPWLSLIPIRPNGTRAPLFCIHGGGGNVIAFRHLADCLSSDQPVYCLQARGLKPGERPLDTVEEMAEYYIEAVRQIYPHGPYLLTGHSFGAAVAYEMAQRWIRDGESVPFLGLLDHPGPQIRLSKLDWLGYQFTALRGLRWREKVEYAVGVLQWQWNSRRVNWRLNRAPQNTPQPQVAGVHQIDIWERTLRALREYQIRPYPGRITLFRAQLGSAKIHSDPLGGWKGLAGEGVEVLEVDGSHMSMLDLPHVKCLGRATSACLDKLQLRQPLPNPAPGPPPARTPIAVRDGTTTGQVDPLQA